MKTKMKTKMKTILSVCMLTILLYSCTKDSVTPEAILDCMGVENGIATYDDCQVCHESYMYAGMGVLTTVATYADTVGVDGIFVLAGSPADIGSNPGWNASCTDCMGVVNGLAAVDDSSCCHQSYMYMPPGQVTIIEMYADTVGVDGMFILAGSPTDIGSNPTWNAGCE